MPTVNFERVVYTFNENEKLQPVLVLTGLSAIDIIVKVSTTDGSAISSKHLYKLCFHKYGSIYRSHIYITLWNILDDSKNFKNGIGFS